MTSRTAKAPRATKAAKATKAPRAPRAAASAAPRVEATEAPELLEAPAASEERVVQLQRTATAASSSIHPWGMGSATAWHEPGAVVQGASAVTTTAAAASRTLQSVGSAGAVDARAAVAPSMQRPIIVVSDGMRSDTVAGFAIGVFVLAIVLSAAIALGMREQNMSELASKMRQDVATAPASDAGTTGSSTATTTSTGSVG